MQLSDVADKVQQGQNVLLLFKDPNQIPKYIEHLSSLGQVTDRGPQAVKLGKGWLVCRRMLTRVSKTVFDQATKGFVVLVVE